MKKYLVTIWFRYVLNGEQEKDFEIIEVEAENESQAKRLACDKFKNHSAIPYKSEITINNN